MFVVHRSGTAHWQYLASGQTVCVFITAGPIAKLCAWGEEDSGGHVL